MTEWLNKLHEAREDTESVSQDIFDVARALERVGMYDIAGELFDIGVFMKRTSKNIGEATAMKVDEDMKCATESSSALFKGIVSGAIGIPKEK